MFKFLATKIWFLAVWVVMLSGCVAPAVQLVDPVSMDSTLTADKGLVTVRVVNASAQRLPFNYITIVQSDLNASENTLPFRLTAIEETVGSTGVFVSQLPPGKYSISNIRSYYYKNERYFSSWANAKLEMGVFEVSAGHVTDLGTLIYYPKSDGDQYQKLVLRSPGSSAAAQVSQYRFSFKFDSQMALRWNEDEGDDSRFTQYASAVQNPVSFNEKYVSQNGEAYFIGKLGYILKREVDGAWIEDAIETDNDLYAIASNAEGDVVVGGEFGTLYVKNSNSDAWQKVELQGSYRVSGVKPVNGKQFDVLAWDLDVLNVIRLNVSDLTTDIQRKYTPKWGWVDKTGEWVSDIGQSLKSKMHWRMEYAYFDKFDGKDILHFGVYKGSSKGFSPLDETEDFSLVFDPASWSMKEFGGFGKGVDRVVDAGAIKLGIKKPGFWVSRITYRRYDPMAIEWIEINRKLDLCPTLPRHAEHCKKNEKVMSRYAEFQFLGIPVFSTEMDAVAVVLEQNQSAYRDPESWVVETHDGGNSWTVVSDELPGKYCSSTVAELKNTVLVSCSGFSSDFYESKDGGKTWQHVRQSENF